MFAEVKALANTKRSAPAPPVKASVPPPPLKVSLPTPPLKLLAALLPVSRLFKSLPVPLIAAAPVSVRFSTLASRVQLRLARTVSVPSPAFSVTTSEVLSTT